MARYSGGQWTTLAPRPWTATYLAVDMLSAEDGWAVGEGSAHWDGSRWRPVSVPTQSTLTSVAVVAPDNAWAVGGFMPPSYEARCEIVHWDGQAWSRVACPVSQFLSDIAFSGPDDGWAVGTRVILHWDGGSWTEVTSPRACDLSTVAAISPLDAWAAGYGCMLHWDGQSWTEDLPAPPLGLSSLSLLPDGTGWAAGNQDFHPYFAKLKSGWWYGWGLERTNDLQEIAAVSSTVAWAVGSGMYDPSRSGPGSTIYYCGQYTSCGPYPSPSTRPLYGIDMLSATDGWAVGGGVILRYRPPLRPAAYLPLLLK